MQEMNMTQNSPMLSVTSAEFVRRFGRWQDRVTMSPIVVTHHGRDRLVMLSMENYRALVCNDDGGAPMANDSTLQLASLLDRMAQGFVAFDNAMRCVAINPVACTYLRNPREAMLGRPLDEFHDDLARSLVHSHLVRAVRHGETDSFEAPSLAYAGTWLHVQTFPYAGGAGCLFRSISGEVENRRQEGTRKAIMASLSAHGAIGFARLSPRATFAEVDEGLAAMAGFSPETLLRVRLTDILLLDQRVSAASEVELVLSEGGTRAFDSALLVNHGGELPVRIAVAAVGGDHASEGAVVMITPR
jgi:PAS domain-containing protein